MVRHKYGFLEAVARLLLTALVLGVAGRILWEAFKLGWSFLGAAA